ncbi:MAG: peptide-binding protein [bacterium]
MGKLRGRGIFPVAIATLLSVFASALAGDGKEKHTYGGTVVLSSLNEPEGINPILSRDTAAVDLANMIFNGLIKLNDRLEPIPDLAESWEVSEDGLTWTFHLRKGVKFHDGVELTSEDVAFTFNSIVDPKVKSPFASLYGLVKSFEAVGRYDFRVVLKEPYAPLLYIMEKGIVPAHLLKGAELSRSEFNRKPIGTGPFKFFEWVPGGEVSLVANEDYFEGRPYLDRVILRVFPDRTAAWSALMQGKVDVVKDLEFEDFKIIKGDPRFKAYDYPSVFYYTLLFNLRAPPFSDKAMREAIDLSIDRSDIIERALLGCGIPTTGPFHPGTWPYNPEVPPQTYDPDGAFRILGEKGWKDTDGDLILDRGGRELGFTLLVDRGDSLKEAVAQRIKWQLFQVGIRVDVEFLDSRDLFRERLIPGKFQAVLLQFNAGIDPDKYTYLFWHSSGAGTWNFGPYRNEEVDRLIEMGRVTANQSERQRIYHRIHSIIAGDRPALFLFFRRRFVGISSKFGGISESPASFYRSIKDWYIFERQQERR